MLPVAEFALPDLTPSSRESLGLVGKPLLQRVELTVLQAEVEGGRLDPSQFLGPAEQATLAGFTFATRHRISLPPRGTRHIHCNADNARL